MNSQDPEMNTSNTSLNNMLFFDNFDYVPDDYDVEDIESMDMTTKTRTLTEADEDEDILLLKDIDIDTETNSNETLAFEPESIIFGSNNENEYFIENIEENANQILSVCPILDLIDGHIQCCSNYSQKQRPLSQLVEAWEIDTKIFQQAQ
ncbi:4087_t:CDS:2, partial [Ambispora gerdemannii]